MIIEVYKVTLIKALEVKTFTLLLDLYIPCVTGCAYFLIKFSASAI
jgi:hypothetical protein